MNWAALLPLLILMSSLLPALLIFFLDERRARFRNIFSLGGAVVKLLLVAGMLWGVANGYRFEFRYTLLPDIDFLLRTDALAMLFVTLSASLWLLTTIYAISYLEGTPDQRRFFGFFSLCVASTVGIALAGNPVTFFLFYELLTVSTYPLVVHLGTDAALRAGRVYLGFTVGGGAVLLVGIVWLTMLAGPVEFVERGGALNHVGPEHRFALTAIFALLIGGLAVKAAIFPLHGWLPLAMVAPAPVSALLHAVAVVKAGAFGIVRVIYDIYGVVLAHSLAVMPVLAVLAAVTIIYGSVRAIQQEDLKRRLAFSTVSQISYIVLGAAVLAPVAIVGALVHLIHQGVMKITLFFCSGILSKTLDIHRVNDLDGVGRRMPITMAMFTLAALGMMAFPPLAGFISKWHLVLGSVEAGDYWVLVLLLLSSLLNAMYFLPLLYRVWFLERKRPWPSVPDGNRRFEAGIGLLVAPLVTGILSLMFGLFAGLDISPLRWAEFIARLEMTW